MRGAANWKVNADPPLLPKKPGGLSTTADVASVGTADVAVITAAAKDAVGGATAGGAGAECEARAREGREGPCGSTTPTEAGRGGAEAACAAGWLLSSGCCCGAVRLSDCMVVRTAADSVPGADEAVAGVACTFRAAAACAGVDAAACGMAVAAAVVAAAAAGCTAGCATAWGIAAAGLVAADAAAAAVAAADDPGHTTASGGKAGYL